MELPGRADALALEDAMDFWLICALVVGALTIDFFMLALAGRGPIPWALRKWHGKPAALDDMD